MNQRPIVYTIKEQVYNILKQGILDGRYAPNEWLQEARIAKELKVSRSPVREALQQLLGDGLVINVPNKGIYVKEITAQDMKDIFEVRMCFEKVGIWKSPQTLTEELKEELVDIRGKLIKYYELEDKTNYIKEDARLHQLIIKLTDNQMIMDVSVRIYTMEHLSRTLSLYSEKRFYESFEEHLGMIDGILAGDIEKAIALNDSHLRLAQEESMKQVKKIL